MALQDFAVDAGAVVEALQVGQRDELHEVPVALVVAGQQDQVVWAAFRGAPVEAALVGHVGLAADDGLDAPVLALGVEIDGAVEGAVVGDRQGAHAQLDRSGRPYPGFG